MHFVTTSRVYIDSSPDGHPRCIVCRKAAPFSEREGGGGGYPTSLYDYGAVSPKGPSRQLLELEALQYDRSATRPPRRFVFTVPATPSLHSCMATKGKAAASPELRLRSRNKGSMLLVRTDSNSQSSMGNGLSSANMTVLPTKKDRTRGSAHCMYNAEVRISALPREE